MLEWLNMKIADNKRKLLMIIFIIPLFFVIPFLQSLFFSSTTKGSIQINKEIEENYIKSDKKALLVFFGYVGCTDVCTPVLQSANDLYMSKEFKEYKKSVEFLFINLTPEVEEFQPDLFAKYFNKNFRGVYLSKKETLNIDRAFGIYFSRGLSDKSELNHTDNIYLIDNSKNRQVIKKMYSTHPLNKKQLISDIKTLLKQSI